MQGQSRAVIILAIYSMQALSSTPANGLHTNKATIYSYAGSLLTPLEFSAALQLWAKESNWNPHARNGSHHGICQGRSIWLSQQDYKKQVRWCIAYAWHRYGTIANAWNFFQDKGWH